MGTVARIAAVVAAVVAVGSAAAPSGSYPAPDGHAYYRDRALTTFAAMMTAFWQENVFVDATADAVAVPQRRADAWPLSQAIAAAVSVASISQSPEVGRTLADSLSLAEANWIPGSGDSPGGYASTAPVAGGPGGDQYYDDNEWLGLDLVAAYRLRPNPELLARARSVFQLITSGWARDATPCSGGVYWVRSDQNRDRNAVTTLNGAILGLELQQLTGLRSYERWALRMFDWAERCLRQSDGLVVDHIAEDGTRDEHVWSYNQGAYIAAAVLLGRATGDHRFIAAADRVATAALMRYGWAFAGEPRAFVAIFFRDLALLDSVRPRPAYRVALDRYGEQAWQESRNPTTGLFAPPDTASSLLDQAAMVQIYASLAKWPATRAR